MGSNRVNPSERGTNLAGNGRGLARGSMSFGALLTMDSADEMQGDLRVSSWDELAVHSKTVNWSDMSSLGYDSVDGTD